MGADAKEIRMGERVSVLQSERHRYPRSCQFRGYSDSPDQARHTDVSTTNRYLGVEKSVHAETKSFKGAFEENQNL